MRCGALGRFWIRNGRNGHDGTLIEREPSLQNIRVQSSGILTGTGVHELNADILCVLASTEIRVKLGFAGERCQEMGENILFIGGGEPSRVGGARRPAGKVNITG